MCEDSETLCVCPLGGILTTISKKWALLIINKLGAYERLRFRDLMEELNGISPKTLSDTLKELQTEQLIARESFPEIPPRVEYYLTEEGLQLRTAIIPLIQWVSRRDGLGGVDCEASCRRRSCYPGGMACTRKKDT